MNSKTNHAFVNHIRFWSMLSIVGVHAILKWGDYIPQLQPTGVLQLLLLQSVKFGSIAFFLISGFLFGDRWIPTSSGQYYWRRCKAVALPWMFWATLFLAMLLSAYDSPHVAITERLVLARIAEVLLRSIYWFVPNALFSLAILVLFRRWINSLIFGAILLSVSLFFGLDLYLGWLPVEHTAAVGGFAFYLWLGFWANRNFDRVKSLIDRSSAAFMCLLTIAGAAAAVAESVLLIHLGSGGYASTLRISNQAFSVLAVLLLLKSRPVSPRFIRVRQETFGIYLIHPFTLILARKVPAFVYRWFTSRALLGNSVFAAHPVLACFFWAATFVIAYGSALLATRGLIVIGAGSLVGRMKQQAKTAIAEPKLQWKLAA